jgi:hypothetical protein
MDDDCDLNVGIFTPNVDETDFLILGDFLFLDSPIITTDNNISREASLTHFGFLLTNITSLYLDLIASSRLQGSKSFNTNEYSIVQLLSFLLADSSAFWSLIEYKRFTVSFLLLFPSVLFRSKVVRIITTGDIIAIGNGILSNFNTEIVCWQLPCNSEVSYTPHFTVMIFVLADLFIHRVCRIIHDRDSAFGLQYVGLRTLSFGISNAPRFPVHGILCLGYGLESSQPFHSCTSFANMRQVGTFGFIHYCNSASIETVMFQNINASINIFGVPCQHPEEVLVATPKGNIQEGVLMCFSYEIM